MDNRKMIYLDDAIDAIKAMPDCPNGFSDTYDKAWIISVLEEVPKEPTGWIPVSERLPEENQICIVTDETRSDTYEYRFCSQTYDEEQGWTYLKHRIIAWMPLPEPYKGEEE